MRFTGSLKAGRDVGEACARELKRATIEAGGKDPMLVLADANIPRAVGGAVWGAFANAGQMGGSLARADVLRERYDRFLAGVVGRAQALRVGHPGRVDDEDPPAGRTRSPRAPGQVIDEALAAGAKLYCGGPVDVAGCAGSVRRPVLTGVPAGVRLCRSTARSWIAVQIFDSEEELIAPRNAGSGGGLGASVWTADQYKGARIAHEFRAGMVWMNDHVVSRTEPQLPWGAVHGAGIGRARGDGALRATVEPKLVTWDPPAGESPAAALRQLARRRLAGARPAAFGARLRPRARLAQRGRYRWPASPGGTLRTVRRR